MFYLLPPVFLLSIPSQALVFTNWVLDTPQETSRWKPGQFYVEERDLELPYPMARGNVSILMVVYFWGDGRRIPAPGADENIAHLLNIVREMSY